MIGLGSKWEKIDLLLWEMNPRCIVHVFWYKVTQVWIDHHTILHLTLLERRPKTECTCNLAQRWSDTEPTQSRTYCCQWFPLLQLCFGLKRRRRCRRHHHYSYYDGYKHHHRCPLTLFLALCLLVNPSSNFTPLSTPYPFPVFPSPSNGRHLHHPT